MKKRTMDDAIFSATILSLALLLLLFLLWYFALQESVRVSSCYFFSRWHIYCPGCGGTRAVRALLQGHPLTSLYYHPAVLFTTLSVGAYLASQTVWRLRGHRGFTLSYSDKWLYVLGLLLLCHCLLRNLLWFVFKIAL